MKIFDIGTFSKHDGPGIRTVVYFQGCTARCDWCHSPQSQTTASSLLFNSNVCTGCGRCAACANKAHIFTGKHQIDRSVCVRCGKCIEWCPQSTKEKKGSALHLPTIEVSPAALFEQIAPYVRLGGKTGGVTLSGGEALLQPQDVRELLILCRQNGFHTAVETSGLLPPDIYTEFAPLVDLWLFGMRVVTGKDHPRHDAHIDEALKRLTSAQARILPRIPMVPSFFDREDVIDPIIRLLQKYSIREICLNPWNRHYDNHYIQSGIPLRMPAPTREEIDGCNDFLIKKFTHFNFSLI